MLLHTKKILTSQRVHSFTPLRNILWALHSQPRRRSPHGGQCNLYAIVFLLMVAAVLHFPIPAWFQTFVSILYPSMGFLNILVYTRPRIQMFRISNPERSWLSSFCLVVRAGGEVPDVEVHPHLKSPCCYCCDFEEVRTDDNESEPNSSFFNIFCMRSYTNTRDQTPTRH